MGELGIAGLHYLTYPCQPTTEPFGRADHTYSVVLRPGCMIRSSLEALVYHIWPVRWGSRPTPLRLWAVAEGKKRVCRVEDSCQNGGFSIPCFSPNPVFLALCPAHLPSDAHLHLGRLNHTRQARKKWLDNQHPQEGLTRMCGGNLPGRQEW